MFFQDLVTAVTWAKCLEMLPLRLLLLLLLLLLKLGPCGVHWWGWAEGAEGRGKGRRRGLLALFVMRNEHTDRSVASYQRCTTPSHTVRTLYY